jgi:hypothetical protein
LNEGGEAVGWAVERGRRVERRRERVLRDIFARMGFFFPRVEEE